MTRCGACRKSHALAHPRTYAIYAYLAAGGATLGGLALGAALLGDREGRVWWPLSRFGSAGMLRACGVTRLRTEGTERLSTARPAVVMANHESLFDPAVLIRAASEPLRFVAKRELSRVPIFGPALAAMGHVFVDRAGADGTQPGLDLAARAIAEGKTVLVFPEGTRSESNELLPFKGGAFRLAVEAQAPIVPVGIAGTRRILPKRGGWQGAGTVALVVGEPVSTVGMPLCDLDRLMARVRSDIEALRERARALCE